MNTLSEVMMVMLPMGSDDEARPGQLLRRKSYSPKETQEADEDMAQNR